MSDRVRAMVLLTVAAAVVVFAAVQDHVTASGARYYADLQRKTMAEQAPSVPIDAIMVPAVERSVREGLLWGGIVLAVGLGSASVISRRSSGE